MTMNTARFRLVVTAALMVCGCATAYAQLAQMDAPTNPQAKAAWSSLAEADLTYLDGIVRENYIYSVYPAVGSLDARLKSAMDEAKRELSLVKDYGSYRAVVQHYIASFEDAHFSGYFTVTSTQARWPAFTVKYAGGRYLIAKSSIPEIHAGDEVESCDGRGLNTWMDMLAPFFSGGPPGRETTRAGIAPQFMIDRGNPLYVLPRNCRIAGQQVALTWQLGPEGEVGHEPSRTTLSAPTLTDGSVDIRNVGNNDAWVRIGAMKDPSDNGDDFKAIIAAAPSLRSKDAVILDVRGNGGGVYNYFMAFLRALYGQPYADYYARARLEISNVIMTPPGPPNAASQGFVGGMSSISSMPPDPPLDKAEASAVTRKLSNGGQLSIWPAPVKSIAYPSKPPLNPVKARVYVLADYGCGSACIAFVDEMMRFPQVTLIGAETHVDRRSGGWPGGFELPSGLVVMRMGRMVREGRARGDNEAWVPAPENRFPGDIADTSEVEKWVLDTIIPRDSIPGTQWHQTATLKGAER
jgi:hypothetical protein